MAGVAGYLVLEKVKQLNADLGGMVEIYVSNGSIPTRTLLQPDQLTKMEIPQKFLTDSHITTESEVVGYVSVVPLEEGDIVTKNMLKNFANLQNENNRLVALYRTDKVQFDQEIAALDRVDIIVSRDADGKKKTEVFMKDVSVAFAQGTRDNFAGIAVEVSAEDAPRLIHMQNYAEHIRVLKANVGRDDQGIVETTEAKDVEAEKEVNSEAKEDAEAEAEKEKSEDAESEKE